VNPAFVENGWNPREIDLRDFRRKFTVSCPVEAAVYGSSSWSVVRASVGTADWGWKIHDG
jgi:hypothetical protein